MSVLEEYERGFDSYYGGDIPTGWENARWDSAESLQKMSRVPYLMGWYQASLADNGMI